jgi:Peptidase of plants and bacteria
MTSPPHSGPKQHSQHPLTPASTAVPIHKDPPALPTIHLRLHPLTHPGAKAFTAALPDVGSVAESAVHTCWHLLYNNEEHLFPRSIRSITVFVRPMGGVAYTTGNWLDGENKEIHVSAEYVERQSKERVRDEIRGVLVHEMVHVWQNNGSFPFLCMNVIYESGVRGADA